MKLPKRHFWEWFQRHHQEYLSLDKKSKKEARYWLQELNAHVRAYFKSFGFSLVLADAGIVRLIITVKGNERYFKKVDAFVATAPDIPGWRIEALEDPIPVDLLLKKQLEVAGINLPDLRFSLGGDPAGETTVTMYHPLYTKGDTRIFWQTACAVLYHLLGERAFGTEIDHVKVDNLSRAEPGELFPLEELPARIGRRSSSMMVDHNGTLTSL